MAATLALLVVTGPGCVYIPTGEHRLTDGHGVIPPEASQALQVGRTSRKEVLLQFGEPSGTLQDNTVFLYDGSVVTGYVVGVVPYLTLGLAEGDERDYRLALTFDKSGILQARQLRHSNTKRTVGDPFSSVKLEVPDGEAVICVYCLGTWWGVSTPIPIWIDDSLLANLQNESFAVITVAPGTRIVSCPERASMRPRPGNRWATSKLATAELDVGPNQRVFLQVVFGRSRFGSLRVEIKEVPETEALIELQQTRQCTLFDW